MQQPNLIKINDTIINMNLVTNVTQSENQIRFEFNFVEHEDDVTLPAFQVEFGNNAIKAYDYLKSQCVAVFDDSNETPPQSEGYIDPTWTKQRVIGIEHKLSSSNNPTWYLDLEGVDRQLYIRQSNKDIWTAHYPQLESMSIGDVAESVDITCYTIPDSDKPEFMQTVKVIADGILDLPEISASSKRKAEVAAALEDYTEFAYADFETTGLLEDDEIIQIGLAYPSGENGEIQNIRDFLVKPIDAQKVHRQGKNGKSAYDIHGIGSEAVETAKSFPEHYDMLKEIISSKALATYGDYDLKMLNQVCAMHNLDPITPAFHINLMEEIVKYIGEPGFKAGQFKWQKLEVAYEKIIGKPLEGAHNAAVDAQALKVICNHIVTTATLEHKLF